MKYTGVIERYKKYLPLTDTTPRVTLYEGNTPLLPSKRLILPYGLNINLFFKCEGFNPTGSFKDRGMTVAVSKAVEENATALICASTGNTSASAAAYAARAGLKCIVLVPSGAIALGKLSQALIHNAQVVAVTGNFDEALTLVRELVTKFPVTLVNSLNPYRIEGQKTAAFEIVDTLSELYQTPTFPDIQFMPVGNAGNITAFWKGYKEYFSNFQKLNANNHIPNTKNEVPDTNNQTPNTKHPTIKLPKIFGIQAAGAAPLVLGKPVPQPETIATAIRIGNPASWQGAITARDESGGLIDTVTDDEIVTAYRRLAAEEGIFVEPASAAAVAGLLKYIQSGYLVKEQNQTGRPLNVVCILTGHGLKDPDRAIKVTAATLNPIPPRLNELLPILGL